MSTRSLAFVSPLFLVLLAAAAPPGPVPELLSLATFPSWTDEGGAAYLQYGWSVATAGDVNGDGYSDVIVGVPEWDSGFANVGAAFAYYGGPNGLFGVNWARVGTQALAEFGYQVAPAGDVNGDGFDDVIVGERLWDGGQTNEGRALIFLGGPGGLAATAAWTVEGNEAGAEFGWTVATAGDVNGRTGRRVRRAGRLGRRRAAPEFRRERPRLFELRRGRRA
jgi:hypothetical protein